MYNIEKQLGEIAEQTKDSSLANCGMEFSFKSKGYQGNHKNKGIARELAEQKKAHTSAVTSTINIFAEHQDFVKKIESKRSEARAYIRKKGHLWFDRWFIPTLHLTDVKNKLDSLKQEYFELVDEAIIEYEQDILPKLRYAQEGEGLGTLFDESLYPSPRALREKFTWQVMMHNVSPSHPLVKLSDGVADDVRRTMEEGTKQAISEIYESMWKSLHDSVANLIKRLEKSLTSESKQGGIVETLLPNAIELCQNLEALNVQNDPKMEKARAELLDILNKHNSPTWRESVLTRHELHDEVKAFASKFDI